jgi:hypothetical protein
MGLDDLDAAITVEYGDLDDEIPVELDRETKHELALLSAALGTDRDELLRRGVHALFRRTLDAGDLDFHLRQAFDVTYDEYLSGMTYDEMTGADQFPQPAENDDRRYQF